MSGLGAISSLAFSRDGRLAVVGGADSKNPAFGPGMVEFIDVPSGRQLFVFRAHDRYIEGMSLSADGRLLAVSSGEGTSVAKVWDVSAVMSQTAGPALGSPERKR